MVSRAILAALSLVVACSTTELPRPGDGGLTSDASSGDGGVLNVAPVVVDKGPTAQSVNVLYTTITLCIPGTTTCQTIDHVEVDTGSVGLRIVSSVLDPSLVLPPAKAASGDALLECYQYSDGFNWGPVVTADVTIGGETAAGLPLHLAGGAPRTPAPPACSRAGLEEDSVATLGG
jgi:hypothetical protein